MLHRAKTYAEVEELVASAGLDPARLLWILDIDEVTLTHEQLFATDAGADVLWDRCCGRSTRQLDRIHRAIYASDLDIRPCDSDLHAVTAAYMPRVLFLTARSVTARAGTARQLARLFSMRAADMEARVVHCASGQSKFDALADFAASVKPQSDLARAAEHGIVFLDDKEAHVSSMAAGLAASGKRALCVLFEAERERQAAAYDQQDGIVAAYREFADALLDV